MVRNGYPKINLSIYPIGCGAGIGLTAFRLASWMHGGEFFYVWLWFSLFVVCVCRWWSDVIYEGTYQGRHTMIVRKLYRLGFKCFLVSEAFFFFGFFWSFLYYGVGELSGRHPWPPRGCWPIDWSREPLFNLWLLVASGFAANVSRRYVNIQNTRKLLDNKISYSSLYEKFINRFILRDNVNLRDKNFSLKEERVFLYRRQRLVWMTISIILGLCFFAVQVHEYHNLTIRMNRGVFGSCFFLITGFHAIHVIFGLGFLRVVWVRIFLFHFRKNQDAFIVRAAVLYWHFVDVVWVFVLLFVYFWRNPMGPWIPKEEG